MDMNDREKVIVFAYEEIKEKITSEKVPLEESTSYCQMIFDSMPKNKEYIIHYFNRNFEEILGEIAGQSDFIKVLKILDLYLPEGDAASNAILDKTIEKLMSSLRNMPDELWRVRVLSQLSEKVLGMVLSKFSNKELNALLYICPQVVNSEGVEKVIKVLVSKKKTKKKLILSKKR